MMQTNHNENYLPDEMDEDEVDLDAIISELCSDPLPTSRSYVLEHIPDEAVGDYALLPLDFKGFYDKNPLFETDDEPLEMSLYTLMAQLCIRANAILMTQCNGCDQWESDRDAIAQFQAIHHSYHGPMNSDWVFYLNGQDFCQVDFIEDEGVSPQRFSYGDTSYQSKLIAALVSRSLGDFDSYLPPRHPDANPQELARCRSDFNAYVGYVQNCINQHWADDYHTFVAYPFASETLFAHIDGADIDQAIADIDFSFRHWTEGPSNVSRAIMGTQYHPAIHLPTATKQVLHFYDDTGIFYRVDSPHR